VLYHIHDRVNEPSIMSLLYSIVLTWSVRMYDLQLYLYERIINGQFVHHLLVSDSRNERLLPCNSLLLYASCEDVA
jgi:hypothetical protein